VPGLVNPDNVRCEVLANSSLPFKPARHREQLIREEQHEAPPRLTRARRTQHQQGPCRISLPSDLFVKRVSYTSAHQRTAGAYPGRCTVSMHGFRRLLEPANLQTGSEQKSNPALRRAWYPWRLGTHEACSFFSSFFLSVF
jgi:hypothetical protein